MLQENFGKSFEERSVVRVEVFPVAAVEAVTKWQEAVALQVLKDQTRIILDRIRQATVTTTITYNRVLK